MNTNFCLLHINGFSLGIITLVPRLKENIRMSNIKTNNNT